jgi:hypothetical protein
MFMSSSKQYQDGQAIVIIALAFVALIAFTGLAIDGGMVYSDRRRAQNASDAGALAGGGNVAMELENSQIDYQNFVCNSLTNVINTGEQTALDSMLINGYTTAVTVTTNCNDIGYKYIDITTTITTETELSFAGVVYDGVITSIVDATTRVTPETTLANGNAIVALNSDNSCDNASAGGLKFGGTGMVRIHGGGAWSDGCLVAQGNCFAQVEEGTVTYVGGNFGTCPEMDPLPTPSNDPLPPHIYEIPPPTCTEADEMDSITVRNNDVIDLNDTYTQTENVLNDPYKAKLICLTSDKEAIKMTGGVLKGRGVTIYLVGGGDVSINGGEVDLSAPVEDDQLNRAKVGLLIYSDAVSDINIEGNHESEYFGTIYAPKADIKITGEGDIGPTLNTQIIGYNVTLLGTAGININFDKTWVLNFPTSLDLQE